MVVNVQGFRVVVAGDEVRVFAADCDEPVVRAVWTSEGCQEARGAGLRAATWDAIDAAIRAAR